MTEPQKKAIIAKLEESQGSSDIWRRYYERPNREWFIRKMIDHLLALGHAESGIESEVSAIILQAQAIVTERLKATAVNPADLKSFWDDRTDGVSVRQIIYDMIALHPEFLDPSNKKQMDFTIDRRVRIFKRMKYFVNPNFARGIFLYPGIPVVGPSEGQTRLNDTASPFWVGEVDFNGVKIRPYVLTTQGKADPVAAVSDLFLSLGTKANYVYCDDCLCMLLMDALQVAADPAKFLKALDGLAVEYFKIDNPYYQYGTTDSSQAAIFLAVTTAVASPGSNVEILLGTAKDFYDDAPNANNANISTDTWYDLGVNISGNSYTGVQFLIALGDTSEVFTAIKANFPQKKIMAAKLNNTYPAGAKIYLQVPGKNYPVYHFINDSRPTHALFEQPHIPFEEVQVGDTIRGLNHPLYHRYIDGPWGEENSLVMEVPVHQMDGSNFDNGIKLAGHGMSQKDGSGLPVKVLITDLLNKVNTVLSIFSAVLPIHLKHFLANGRADGDHVKAISRTENGISFTYFEYDVAVTSKIFGNLHKEQVADMLAGTDFAAGLSFISPDMFKDEWTFNGFVIRMSATSDQEFTIYNINTKDSTKPQNSPVLMVAIPPYKIKSFDTIAFMGTDFNSGKSGLSNWGVAYLNVRTLAIQNQLLFESDNKTPKRIRYGDLKKEKMLFFSLDYSKDAVVTRPRVDFSSAFPTLLQNLGAFS